MKILTLVSILGLSLCTTPLLNAQEKQSPWTFGVKAGMNISKYNIDGNFLSNTEGVIGFNGGVTVDYALRNNFFLSSGLDYTTKGTDYSTNISRPPLIPIGNNNTRHGLSTDSRRFHFLQLPVTVGYRIPVSSVVNVTFNVGGYVAFGLSGEGIYDTYFNETDANGFQHRAYNSTKSTKSGDTDYGLLGGLGLEYKKFVLNANYELGLRGVFTGQTYDNQVHSQWKNRNWALSVGYKF